jgi:hypothetical protein
MEDVPVIKKDVKPTISIHLIECIYRLYIRNIPVKNVGETICEVGLLFGKALDL